jgi:hypothetical protein
MPGVDCLKSSGIGDSSRHPEEVVSKERDMEARIRAREDRRDSDRNALFKNESYSRLAVHVAARDIGRPSVLSKVVLEVLPTREPAPKALCQPQR